MHLFRTHYASAQKGRVHALEEHCDKIIFYCCKSNEISVIELWIIPAVPDDSVLNPGNFIDIAAVEDILSEQMDFCIMIFSHMYACVGYLHKDLHFRLPLINKWSTIFTVQY